MENTRAPTICRWKKIGWDAFNLCTFCTQMKCMGEEGAIVCGGRDCMTTPVLGLVAQSISIFPIEGVRDKPNERQIFVPLSES